MRQNDSTFGKKKRQSAMRVFIVLFLSLFLCGAQAVLIPAARLNDWTPGTMVGVQGGIPTNRTTLLNVVSGYSADNTGASDASTAIQSAINAAGTNEIVYLPVGVYRLDSALTTGYKDDFTIRGQGTTEGDAFALSRSTNTIGTGTKTFTVPAGLGYTAGCGVWVWKWDRNDALITSITRSGATATVTTSVPHLRATGETVTITGATQTDYDGDHTITVTGASTFTYTVANSPATPATTSYQLRFRDSSLDGPNMWMKGTCTSYSGTTLTVSVATSATSGTWSMWKCSLVVLDTRGSIALEVGGDIDGGWFVQDTFQSVGVTVEGSPAKGATSFVVSGWDNQVNQDVPAVGQLAQVSLRNQYDATAGAVGDNAIVASVSGYDWIRRQMLLITNVTGSGSTRTITFTPPLAFNLPTALEPKFHSTSSVAKNVGVESLAVFCHNSAAVFAIRFHQALNCWAKGVSSHCSNNYCLQSDSALFIEVRRCWLTHRNAGGSNGAAFLIGCNSHLLIDSVLGETNDPAWEVSGWVTGGACLYNYCPVTAPNNNHGPHASFNLYEGNLCYGSLSDGYFGGNSEDTNARNYFFGVRYGGASGMDNVVPGSAGIRRFGYNINTVGNVMGTQNYANGDTTVGLPNIGNGSSQGTASALTGDRHLHMNTNGGIAGTLTTRTNNTDGVVTMTSLVQADIESPYTFGAYNTPGLVWNGTGGNRHTFTISSVSGSTFSISGGSGANLPTQGTAVVFFIGQSGWQENDLDVAGTLIEKGNYIVSGSGGAQSSLGGDTVPNSYAYGSAPSFFGNLTWPPVNPASPTFSKEIIPAGYRYLNGTDPGASSGGGSGTTSFSGSGTTTLSGSGTTTIQ